MKLLKWLGVSPSPISTPLKRATTLVKSTDVISEDPSLPPSSHIFPRPPHLIQYTYSAVPATYMFIIMNLVSLESVKLNMAIDLESFQLLEVRLSQPRLRH